MVLYRPPTSGITTQGNERLAEVHEMKRNGSNTPLPKNSKLGGEDNEWRGDISAELHLYMPGRVLEKVGGPSGVC